MNMYISIDNSHHRYQFEQTTLGYTDPAPQYRQTYPLYFPAQSPVSFSQSVPASPQFQQFTYTTPRSYQIIYNSLPATRQAQTYYSQFTSTGAPIDVNRAQVYLYTAETKQREYTVPLPSLPPSTDAATSTTTQLPFYLRYKFSTTKNPYDFKDFTTLPRSTKRINMTSTIGTTTTSRIKPYFSVQTSTTTPKSVGFAAWTTSTVTTTLKPKFGFLSKLDFRDYFNRTTTKNPYDFDPSNYREISNNNIKRSYSIGSYFAAANSPVAVVAGKDESLVAQASQSIPVSLARVK